MRVAISRRTFEVAFKLKWVWSQPPKSELSTSMVPLGSAVAEETAASFDAMTWYRRYV